MMKHKKEVDNNEVAINVENVDDSNLSMHIQPPEMQERGRRRSRSRNNSRNGSRSRSASVSEVQLYILYTFNS